jgi:hypothetical protein
MGRRRYQQDQKAEAAENGKPWFDTGYVFVDPTASRSTRTTPPPGSGSSSGGPGWRRSGYPTCATAPRPWPTRPARI